MRTTRQRIFLTGLTSLRLGKMEYENLGNYTIIEPLVELLLAELPSAEVRTTLQLSDVFCERYGIISLHNPRFWSYGRRSVASSLLDFVIACIAAGLRLLGLTVGDRLVRRSTLLRELAAADLVLDFSGDRYGDNVDATSFMEATLRLLIAKTALRRPTAMVYSSLGPFTTGWRRRVARFVLPRLDLVVTREMESLGVLSAAGVPLHNVWNGGCPSFLFEVDSSAMDPLQVLPEGLSKPTSRPLVGLILCDLNMLEGTLTTFPRSTAELGRYVSLIAYLVQHINAQVCVFSHENRYVSGPRGGEMAPGMDHRIVDQLLDMVRDEGIEGVHTLDRCLTAAESRVLIRQFDMLISGRIHGAVQGLSQGIPTAIIEYGLGPRAHKVTGIARLAQVEAFVCQPCDVDDMIGKVADLWVRRCEISERLNVSVAEVQDRVRSSMTDICGLIGRE